MMTVVDYGLGNIKAFANVYHRLNITCNIASTITDLEKATKLILPGVGAFDYTIDCLMKSGLKEKLDELVLVEKIHVLGICVGMQMLAESSDEGKLKGLGWIKGKVRKLDMPKNLKHRLPHMGWNSIEKTQESPLLKNLGDSPKFYFLHSYYFECSDNQNSLAITDYGIRFCSVVNVNNIYGIQCHPEKSHSSGITLLKNFAEL